MLPLENRGLTYVNRLTYNDCNEREKIKGLTMNTLARAPKGGMNLNGVFYKGGQFLPSDYEPKKGKYNRAKSNSPRRARKVEVAPYTWVEAREGFRPLYSLAGVVMTFNNGVMVAVNNDKVLSYAGYTREAAQQLADAYNAGERWLRD